MIANANGKCGLSGDVSDVCSRPAAQRFCMHKSEANVSGLTLEVEVPTDWLNQTRAKWGWTRRCVKV